jgi:hypothetical protein
MDAERINEVEGRVEEALKAGTLLILNPQFMVTARLSESLD